MKIPSILLLAAATTLGSTLAAPDALAQSHSSSVTITSSRGRLGAQVIGISEHLRRFFGAPADAGLLVDHVLPDSPAAKAGLQTGDVIVNVGQTEVSEAWDIFEALGTAKKGDKINIRVLRNKKPKTLQAILTSDPGPDMNWGDLSNPFGGPPNWKHERLFRDGKDFPFGPMLEGTPRELQEKIQRLEERLDRLEGSKGGSNSPSPGSKKSPQRHKGTSTTQGKQS